MGSPRIKGRLSLFSLVIITLIYLFLLVIVDLFPRAPMREVMQTSDLVMHIHDSCKQQLPKLSASKFLIITENQTKSQHITKTTPNTLLEI